MAATRKKKSKERARKPARRAATKAEATRSKSARSPATGSGIVYSDVRREALARHLIRRVG